MDDNYRHQIRSAWPFVSNELFGSVCEVARRVPRSCRPSIPDSRCFQQHREDIINVSVDQFLSSDDRYDTILLHILSGEGAPKDVVLEVLNSAYSRCLKVVVLEHSPHSDLPDLEFIREFIEGQGELCRYFNWGRNLLWSFTTMAPFHIPQLNDDYYQRHIDNVAPVKHPSWVDENTFVYAHTSESNLTFDLPNGTIWWVIGGGLAYENMCEGNHNILFDSIFRQAVYCAKIYGVPTWKTDKLYCFDDLVVRPDFPQWRVATVNGVKPDSIRHLDLRELMCKGCTVYTSTVERPYWKHLAFDNNIIESLAPRNTPKLVFAEKNH